METATLTNSFFLIFTGAAILASLALFTRQPLIIAYIALGALLGPFGFGLVTDVQLLSDISKVGIIFLLFLLGLDMQPQALVATLRKATFVAIVSCALFMAMGVSIALLFGFEQFESVIIGAAMMFSSTIISIKLLPTTVLHHRHTGELMIGLLLIQDMIAILVLTLLLSLPGVGSPDRPALWMVFAGLPLLLLIAVGMVKFALLPLITRFDRFHEYIFLLAIGWCLGMSELAHVLGLSSEIGAFIAGVALATSPISQYIAVNLKPLRDFFLVMFFFSIGARFDLGLLHEVILAAVVLAAIMLAMKPIIFRFLLKEMSEKKELAWDLGLRLGQVSEFSLLIAYVAAAGMLISEQASLLIQATTLITFVISSYIVIFTTFTPIAISDKLRRD
ncbi:MAG: Kef-type K+ transport system membrane component KefB [Halieaceae bacterium]|jgi:Kef-type K+ transport system membrane component KefB